MTKSDLIEILATKKGIPQSIADQAVRIIFDSMTNTLTSDGRIEIRGFGSFELRKYEGYTGRNPKTGAKTIVAPKKSPFFKVGKELKARIMEEKK
ncbi:MAG: HU family DNA-binding protein [Deltaproteobacteria bacterium]